MARRILGLAWFALVSASVTWATPPEGSRSRVDLHGDPLPEGAVARLGSMCWRHGARTAFVTFLPGDKTILTTDLGWNVHVWDATTGREIRRFSHVEEVYSPLGRKRTHRTPLWAGLSADGKTLATGGRSGRTVAIWEVDTGKAVGNCSLDFGILHLSLTRDGQTIAVVADDLSVHLLNRRGRQVRRLFLPAPKGAVGGHQLDGAGTSFSSDGKRLVQVGMEAQVGGRRWTLKIFDTQNGKLLHRLEDEEGWKNWFCLPTFSPDDELLARASPQGDIQLLNTTTYKLTRIIKTGFPHLESIAFTPDGRHLVGRSLEDDRLGVWDVETGKALALIGQPGELPLHRRWRWFEYPASLARLALSSTGTKAALADGNLVRVVELATGKDLLATNGHRADIKRASFERDGKTITTQSFDGTIRRWDMTGKEGEQVRFRPPLPTFALSPDGKRLLSEFGLREFQLLDVATGKRLWSQQLSSETHHLSGCGMAFSPDGRFLALRSQYERVLGLFSAETGKPLATLGRSTETHDRFFQPSLAVAFSPDSQFVAGVGAGEDSILVGEMPVGHIHREMRLPAGEAFRSQGKFVRDLCFSCDGRTLLVDLCEDSVLVYELRTGTERRRYLRKGDERRKQLPPNPDGFDDYMDGGRKVSSLAVSSDGRRLALAGANRTIYLWDVLTGEEIGRLKGHEGDVLTVAFSPDGRQLLSGGEDGQGFVWDVAALKSGRPLPSQPDAAKLGAYFEDLSAEDGKRAFAAVGGLVAAEQGVRFLGEKLRPVPTVDAGQINKLIAELEGRSFPARRKAQAELEKLGGVAGPTLKAALAAKPALELSKRIEELLEKVRVRHLSAAQLQTVRGIEVLERVGTAAAKVVLQKLAKGAAGAVETIEAQAALDRLARFP